MPEIIDDDYTSIIPTAYLTAYPRTFTDIPYSKEIFDQLELIRAKGQLPELSEEFKIPRLAPELEARYKLIDRMLSQSDIHQVLELAAGLSARGLIMAADSSVEYSELDLEDMAAMKREILGTVATIPHNLHITSGNALRLSDLEQAIEGFDTSKPLAVINEGLLRYLGFAEKAAVAKNVHKLLERFGGVWITCDTTPKKFLATQDTVTKPGFNKGLVGMSGKDFSGNMFEDEQHATKFFTDLGFSVEIHQFSEIASELSSPAILKLPDEEVAKLINFGVVVVMRAT